ncbi:phage integrase site specific recombinase [Parascardovia denticolens IPLA 20019]|uniref:hypothetical protein n=1 Tax=Parascardovia denticolens TaxID=78258 RepID=UPI000266B4D8|nr:hypothetical protein [Parascardovia denticolens]EIT88408.1 phage integrase site specific recombinase [Parascardovia denticolens IPLA 20019]
MKSRLQVYHLAPHQPNGIQAKLEELQKELIKKITVFAGHFTVEFKSGIIIEIEA